MSLRPKNGKLFTRRLVMEAPGAGEYVTAEPGQDILKIAVVNRYREAPPALALVKGFGPKRGAIASSVAHDSHNIVAMGTNDKDLARAVNLIMESLGGLAAADGEFSDLLPLPVAGIMTQGDAFATAEKYAGLNRIARKFGSTLTAPFMALLVIPS